MLNTNSTPTDQPVSFFASLGRRLASVVTLRRLGLSMAGTVAFVGAAAVLHAGAGTVGKSTSSTTSSGDQTVNNQQNTPATPSNTPAQALGTGTGGSSARTSLSATATGGNANVQMTVNGQNIPVAPNSSTHRTIANTDGTQTTIDSSSTSQGGASNSSSSSFTLNVTSNSSSTGGSGQ